MIAYIKGKIAYKSRTKIIIETYGIGYEIEISLNTYNKIQAADEVQLLIAQIIREDAHTLYGFAEGDEKNMFEHLISVAGVGPNTARILLSALQPAEIRAAIIAEKETILRNAKGIGPKNAKRIILELKDKLLKDSGAESEQIAATLVSENPVREEALSALVALGFNKIQVQKTLNAVLKDNPQVRDSGDLIKMALGALT